MDSFFPLTLKFVLTLPVLTLSQEERVRRKTKHVCGHLQLIALVLTFFFLHPSTHKGHDIHLWEQGWQHMRWRRQWHPTPVLLPGKSHGWRSLVGCSLWGREESDITERLHFHFSLSCTGDGNGNPLQCSCLENPRDGGAGVCHLWGRTESDTTEVTQQQHQQQHKRKELGCGRGSVPSVEKWQMWKVRGRQTCSCLSSCR